MTTIGSACRLQRLHRLQIFDHLAPAG